MLKKERREGRRERYLSCNRKELGTYIENVNELLVLDFQ